MDVKIDAMLDIIMGRIMTKDVLPEYLDFMSRLSAVDYRNQLLIFGYHPSKEKTRMVAGMQAWRALGREVKKGADPVLIIYPEIEKTEQGEFEKDENGNPKMEEEGRYHLYKKLPVYEIHERLKPVYAYEDTEGTENEMGYPQLDIHETLRKLDIRLEEESAENIRNMGNQIQVENQLFQLDGYLTENISGQKIIRIKEGMTDLNKQAAIMDVMLAAEIVRDESRIMEHGINQGWMDFPQLLFLFTSDVLKRRYRMKPEINQMVAQLSLQSVTDLKRSHLLLHGVQHIAASMISLFEEESLGFLETMFANQITNDGNLVRYVNEIMWIVDGTRSEQNPENMVYHDKLFKLCDIMIRMYGNQDIKDRFLCTCMNKKLFTFPPYQTKAQVEEFMDY